MNLVPCLFGRQSSFKYLRCIPTKRRKPLLSQPGSVTITALHCTTTHHVQLHWTPCQCTFDDILRHDKSQRRPRRPHTCLWHLERQRPLLPGLVGRVYGQKSHSDTVSRTNVDQPVYAYQRTCSTNLRSGVCHHCMLTECSRRNLECSDRSDWDSLLGPWIHCIPRHSRQCPRRDQNHVEGPKIIPWQPQRLCTGSPEVTRGDILFVAAVVHQKMKKQHQRASRSRLQAT